MPASSRMSATARCRMSSKVFERWLISITDIPTPGSATRSRCASSRTGSGRTAGPAAKLKIRVVVTDMSQLHCSRLQPDYGQIQNVFVARDPPQDVCARLAVEIDPRDRSLRAVENDVLG